jgi:hypothetical protein
MLGFRAGGLAAHPGGCQRAARTSETTLPHRRKVVRASGAGPGSCDAASAAILLCGAGI